MTLDGAPAADVFVVPKYMGDQMIEAYVKNAGPAAIPAPPRMDEQLVAGQPFQRFVPLPKGLYYLVLDHSAPVGRTAPPQAVGDDRAAKIDYVVQVGEAP
jgi:hypothetical protein